ncbi:hypothetical protein BUALT_Bualt11G0009800 [Buddleja alternifolia]|uniref:4-hydroxy-4-methyl-2-oxoglutarate aldolase n=1 Tax=Buddleja alternifolia TaxID=168488 RepID=A0AAV6WXY5_9LAMI|nr:hypothetical protein BUALT_Bualt11G0009800 [Buddleja alternifolia]
MSQHRGNSSGAFRKLPQSGFNQRPPPAKHQQRPLKNVVRISSSSINPSIGPIGGGSERLKIGPQYFHSLVDEDCVGAIDGSRFHVKVSISDAPRYQGRKSYPTQNVLVACTFDLKNTYFLSSWEGSASESRILKDALSREHDHLIVPQESKVEGRVLVIGGGANMRSTMIGSGLTGMAQDNRWAGIIVYGCIRDADEINGCDIGVRALASCPRKPAKVGITEKHAPVNIEGTMLHDGEWLISCR